MKEVIHAIYPLRLFIQTPKRKPSCRPRRNPLRRQPRNLWLYRRAGYRSHLLFTTPYGASDHSVASAEIEVRAKLAEFDHPTKSHEELREDRMVPFKKALSQYIAQESLPAGIVFTITFQDWSVEFLPGMSAEPASTE